ncbi:haloacid dehalogenase superfamily, subfamily IA, variant 3 with third motif having DD or ED/haloacid dehalogenase superfamily, subfamily IA, variant 1 with third motif having Dx(3-4)D or Dx(3-4)E [Amycolatopsis marina]|uniref:Haloacid dehalogenase superfamily, subfamily IA, variant 3 with third motif having DD or ED/haloacid dehalogenase superfamily, subfamily IA, variant 1 with third motif having Dx(3-4)D or Dx(3-4)E n=1 Tax=Amycolatopsis marina TaxID=490629 RepID=A0A1I1CMX7_9PSEU|nr:HAD-IA family hydrolase [Amycolatopsis marina]SFB61980.1 haloacid dehalogenase superfamily, subfamily IA, variant 3 with third motif having DD or ED/haloacid dehalogenase superfamily, subfamily IA, variant 1 with third motif having Dx(3-4)D or Dx(3-4)E [Amycolatopsis marina]
MLRGLVLDYAGVLTDVGASELLDALERARTAGIRTALLSNAASGESVRRSLSPYFDEQVYSGEVGVAKPDREVFLLTAERLGVPADACVFVDDAAGNVAGAVAAGMVGVHHSSVPETLAELEVLFPSLRPS